MDERWQEVSSSVTDEHTCCFKGDFSSVLPGCQLLLSQGSSLSAHMPYKWPGLRQEERASERKKERKKTLVSSPCNCLLL